MNKIFKFSLVQKFTAAVNMVHRRTLLVRELFSYIIVCTKDFAPQQTDIYFLFAPFRIKTTFIKNTES